MTIVYCLLLVLFPAAVPYGLVLLVEHLWSNWPKRTKLLLSALPLPLLFAIPSAVLLVDVATRPSQACMKGVCYIDRLFGIEGLILATIFFVIGLVVAGVALGKAARAEP